ncbi:MAG: tripartite tricarboxylate transporter substrate binding protein [Betaproteobacteria bacterium]|nr:tripartite tricarboxylate transporter substrate binding protein [Betaproteobacteria bacterium]
MKLKQFRDQRKKSAFICVNLRRMFFVVSALAVTHATAQPKLPMDAPKPAAYPDKPIRFIVPFAPGGTTDLVARLVGQEMSRMLGQPLVIDNRGGAGGTIAADIVAKAAADGYTLMLNHQGLAINATLYAKLPYETLKDFAAIAMVGVTPNVLVVNTQVTAKSVKELVALARAKPKSINYGSGGIGSSAHLAVELFQRLADVQLQHVPYKGAGPALTDTVGGQIQMMIATMPAAAAHIRANRLRALGVSGAKRSPAFPELPTIAEAGVPGYDYSTWYGVLGPRALPQPIVQYVAAVTNKTIAQKDMRDRLAQQGMEVEMMTPEKFTEVLRNDVARWSKIIREAGIRAE